MLIFSRAQVLQAYIAYLKQQGLQIGFVPTMGALHAGHLSLIERAQEEADVSICSIFVNPKQFNDPADLEKYPRAFSSDAQMLARSGCKVLYHPTVSDIYPPHLDTSLDMDLNGLAKPMEGEHRPGHFQGMLEVVKRLLDIVTPHYIYMGQKDYQQYLLVARMVSELSLPVDVRVCPIIREPDGLAMSSRNRRLDPDFRRKAAILYQTLSWAEQQIRNGIPSRQVEEEAFHRILESGLQTEYFTILDAQSLKQPVENNSGSLIACTAAKAGNVRLIDNKLISILPD